MELENIVKEEVHQARQAEKNFFMVAGNAIVN